MIHEHVKVRVGFFELPVVTSYICPPIPTNRFDWCAYPEGCEEDGNYGWGATEQEAIENLMEMQT